MEAMSRSLIVSPVSADDARPAPAPAPPCMRQADGTGRSLLWAAALIAALAVALAPTAAQAQEDPDDEGLVFEEDDDEGDGDEGDGEEEPMEFGADPITRPGEVPTGAGETPDPIAEFDAEPEPRAEPGPAVPSGYPVELALRPRTLPPGMAEFGLDTSFLVAPALTSSLRARYSIIERFELGLRYGIVGLDDNNTETGRAVAIDTQVKITDWLAAQLTLPVMFDPVAVGVTLGAPLQVSFGRSFALFFGRDLVTLRIEKFAPTVVDPLADAQNAALDQDNNTIVSRGDLRFLGGAIYQLEPNLALVVDGGVIAPNFEGENAQVPLGLGATWSPLDFVDLAGRLGFGDLGEGDSFGLSVALAFRL